jgi:TatD DNase family protein
VIDFHCHLDLYPDPRAVAEQAQRDGVAVLSVTTTPSAFRGTRELAADLPAIRTALGLHPELARRRGHELELFDELVSSIDYVGEVGLDGSARFNDTREQQTAVLDHVLGSCAKAGGRILTIHSRAAAQPVLDALCTHPDAGIPVLHWFTGTPRQARSAIAQGCWFSVNSPMLGSTKSRELLGLLPRDRVLTETDGPFTRTGDRPAIPGDVSGTVESLARIWEMPADEVSDTLAENLRALHAGLSAMPRDRRTDR